MLGLLDHWRTRTHGALDARAEVITRVWKGAEKQGRVPPRDELAARRFVRAAPALEARRTDQTAARVSDLPPALNLFAKSYIAGHAADV